MLDPSQAKPLNLPIQGQAEFLDRIVGRCITADGKVAAETWLRLTVDEVNTLTAISNRLHVISPYAARIKDMVQGK